MTKFVNRCEAAYQARIVEHTTSAKAILAAKAKVKADKAARYRKAKATINAMINRKVK